MTDAPTTERQQTVFPLSKLEAVVILEDSDHCFINEKYTRAICEAFGVKPLLETQTVDSTAFKGLNQAWDDNGNELPDGTKIYGCDAANLAEYLNNILELPFFPMMGRGSRLRSAASALRKYAEEAAA